MIKRFTFELFHCNGGDMTPDAEGEYVSYEDYAALQQKLDRLQREYNHVINQHMPRTSEGCDEGWSRVIEAQELQQKLDAADNLANLCGAMINDLLRRGMPENIADIIDSGDLEAICYGHEYPGAEKHRMALFNFRMTRRSEAGEVSNLIRSGTHDTADKAGAK